MSIHVETWRVEQYGANVYHLLQQKGSKLRSHVRLESITGKSRFFDQLGATNARLRTSRHADTPRMDTPHARRRVTTADYDWADLIDDEDKLRMLSDPTSPYAEAAAMAFGRTIDDVLLAAMDATAYTGETGATSTSFDTNMVVDVQTVWPGVSAADTGLNLAKLIEARKKLGANEVDPDEEVFVAVNARQISSLLKDERVVSGDYNSALPLISGKVSRVGGCTLVPCNRIGVDSNSDDKCFYWTKSGILLAMGKEPTSRVSERADKGYATQVYMSMTLGATRMEEGRVGYIECDPGASPTTDA
jgi:hypothetical protein